MVIAYPPTVESTVTVLQGQTETDKQGEDVDASNKTKCRIGGTKVILGNEFPENPEELGASSNNLTDERGIYTYLPKYCVPDFGNTRGILEEESQGISTSPDKQPANEWNLAEEGGLNTPVPNKEKYGYHESNGGKIIPDDELLDLRVSPEPPDNQNSDVLDCSDFKDIQEKRKIKTQRQQIEDKNFQNRLEHHVNDLIDDYELEEQLEPPVKEKPYDFLKVLVMKHLKDLIRQKKVKYLTHFRVKRRSRMLCCEYHHHYLVMAANDDGMVILHLTTDQCLNLVCRKEYIDFSNNSQCNNLLNFDLGVELVHRYDMPTNEKDLKAIEERILEMCGLDFVEYSLTSPEKWYCESLVSYVMTGKKDSIEVEEFLRRFGKRAEIIIFSINNFCTFKSLTRRLRTSLQGEMENNRFGRLFTKFSPVMLKYAAFG